MEIKTKYNIGDLVFFEYNNKACSGRIDGINVDVEESNEDTLIYYHVRGFNGINVTLPESSFSPISH